jgi:hypothetical protein
VNLSLADLTSAEAVQAALDEFSSLGQEAFLARYGFGKSREYVVRDPESGRWADSKAIAGAALVFQFPGRQGLRAEDFSGGDSTVVRKLQSLGFEVRRISDITGSDWTHEEVALTVADHLSMLTKEFSGQRYSKTNHRRQLMSRLPGRSEGAIEFKHANISAVMLELGYPYLRGYQPRANFQRSVLLEEVARQVARHEILDAAALAVVQRPAATAELVDFARVRTEAPRREQVARESVPACERAPIQRDYLQREAQNRSLGLAGEELALQFERWRLVQLGAAQLAERVVHASRVEGDGLGYDIRSYEADGMERFIEVKTTTFGDRTPFFVSANEVSFSRERADAFHLYRLFEFRTSPRMFTLNGSIETNCQLDATTFRASFG